MNWHICLPWHFYCHLTKINQRRFQRWERQSGVFTMSFVNNKIGTDTRLNHQQQNPVCIYWLTNWHLDQNICLSLHLFFLQLEQWAMKLTVGTSEGFVDRCLLYRIILLYKTFLTLVDDSPALVTNIVLIVAVYYKHGLNLNLKTVLKFKQWLSSSLSCPCTVCHSSFPTHAQT